MNHSSWRICPPVFFGSTLIILMVVGLAIAIPEQFAETVGAIKGTLVGQIGSFYLVSMTAFLVFALWLACGRFGKVRLSADDSEPEFNRLTWFTMLFSAGMGIGLLFFSVAEPVMHYVSPPTGDAYTREAARQAMGLTFFHWGLHPWSVYAIVGLCLGYFTFRKGQPLSMRSALVPLLGDRALGRIGDCVDVLAVVSTMFGVATSLGLGAMQIASGLHQVVSFSESTGVYLGIIAAITTAATISVVTGLKAGIRRLSEFNMSCAALLLVFVFITGPTVFLIVNFAQNLGSYAQTLLRPSFMLGTSEAGIQSWLTDWTVFYWAWWISWSPFVGTFIARISKGRTVREYVIAVFVVPTLMGFVWLTVFGGSALHPEVESLSESTAQIGQPAADGVVDYLYPEVTDTDGEVARLYNSDRLPRTLFHLLDGLPLSGLMSIVATLCIVLFFVTSSDSASLVIDTIASGGVADPPVAQRIYWAVLEGVVAAALLLAGGLGALQSVAIASAAPFCVVVIVMSVSLTLAFHRDEKCDGHAE